MDKADEVTIFIQTPRNESNEIFEFLNSNGVRAVKHFGTFNHYSAPNIDPNQLAQIAKDGTPYLMVYGLVKAMVKAIPK